MRHLVPILISLSLIGCATKPVVSAAVQAEADTPLTCEGKAQCELYWQRAQFYVNKHSRFKIQMSNDVLIQTYSPTGGTSYLGYNISKEVKANGSARLWVKLWCDNMFGCNPDIVSEIASLKRYARTGE